MKAIVTGGAGFIGSHLVDALIENGDDVVVMDDLSLGKLSNINKRARASVGGVGDCTWKEHIYRELTDGDVDVIYNLAVRPLPESLVMPDRVVHKNIEMTLAILEVTRKMGDAPRLVHFSSSEVYGSSDKKLSEDSLKRPATPYAASKLACDALVESYVETFELDAVIVRPFNTIGPRQNEGSYAAVIPETLRRIHKGEHPYVTGNGLQSRDFVYVEDVAKGAILAAEHGISSQTYVLATGETRTIRDVVEKTSAAAGYKNKIDTSPARAGDVYRLCGDPSKAMIELGWKPIVSFEEALKRTVNWYESTIFS